MQSAGERHVNQLNDFGQAVGLSGSIKAGAGYFSGVYDPNSRIYSLKKMKNTHEDTWRTLVECLNKISKEVLGVTGLRSHQQQISASISELVYKLTDGGRLLKGNYLSRFRNAVNYRQEYDSWHPYGKHSIKSEKIISLLETWRNEEDTSTSAWKESLESFNFFSTCRNVVNLNYFLIQLIVKNSKNKNNFYKRWPNNLLNITSTT